MGPGVVCLQAAPSRPGPASPGQGSRPLSHRQDAALEQRSIERPFSDQLGKKYNVVFLFENQKPFDSFVDKGWQADTQAGVAAGTAGADAAATFRGGVAVYQITDKGLMASVDITGTKYWKHKKLN